MISRPITDFFQVLIIGFSIITALELGDYSDSGLEKAPLVAKINVRGVDSWCFPNILDFYGKKGPEFVGGKTSSIWVASIISGRNWKKPWNPVYLQL